MRSVGALPLLATAAFAGEISIGADKPFENSLGSCGNCWVEARVWSAQANAYVPGSTSGATTMCVTGVNDAAVNQGTNDAPHMPTNTNTTASAWTIQQIIGAFEHRKDISFDHLFCANYLKGYKDGKGYHHTTGEERGPIIEDEEDHPEKTAYGPDGPGFYPNGPWGYGSHAGTGAACVRAKTVDAIVAADREVYAEWLKWGSSGRDAPGGEGPEGGPEGVPNGYASGYALVSGQPDWEQKKWGTGYINGGSDLPANWCKVQMKEMLCHVAFPQVWGHTQFATNANPAEKDLAHGRVRSVDYDSCRSVMQTCTRRQPSGDETNTDYMAHEFNSTLGMFIQRPDVADVKGEKELQVDRPCDFWRLGLGIAKAGTGVAENKAKVLVAQFGSASRASIGYLAALVLSLMML